MILKKIKKFKKNSEIINFSQEEIIKNNSTLYNEASNVSLFEKEKIIFIEELMIRFLIY